MPILPVAREPRDRIRAPAATVLLSRLWGAPLDSARHGTYPTRDLF
ncbi:hypothetical protein [Nocardiopsis protaetiae]